MRSLTRTTFVSLGLLAGTASTAAADVLHAETIVHNTTTSLDIELNQNTVLCSSADYSGLFLKVLIPKLASLTLLDHQNFGAGAPCVAAGPCEPGRMPEDILDASQPTEHVAIHVRAVRLDETDTVAQTCSTSLIENINVTIRGFEFKHTRSAWLGDRPFSDCVKGAPANDNPADDPGQLEQEPKSGGCAAGTGVGSLTALMLGALVAVRRRRRARV
ncbi:MAG TPA: hypothetical protein VIV11_29445 [Kofleriaceae bacterium]